MNLIQKELLKLHRISFITVLVSIPMLARTFVLVYRMFTGACCICCHDSFKIFWFIDDWIIHVTTSPSVFHIFHNHGNVKECKIVRDSELAQKCTGLAHLVRNEVELTRFPKRM